MGDSGWQANCSAPSVGVLCTREAASLQAVFFSVATLLWCPIVSKCDNKLESSFRRTAAPALLNVSSLGSGLWA